VIELIDHKTINFSIETRGNILINTEPQVTTIFTCDTCHKQITDPSKGYFQWIRKEHELFQFSIVHINPACHIARNSGEKPLDIMLGRTGIQDLDNMLDPTLMEPFTIGDMQSFMEVRRRLTWPLYEEARL